MAQKWEDTKRQKAAMDKTVASIAKQMGFTASKPAKKATPKPKPTPTKKGLNVAVPGGGTYNTATGKTTRKPKDIPFKQMTPKQYEAQLKKAVAEHNRALRNK